MNKSTIKVIGNDLMCFPVDAETLKPLKCGCYDPWAWSDPEPGEHISIGEWNLRVSKKAEKAYAKRYRDYISHLKTIRHPNE